MELTFKNNEVALEQCWIRENSEFSEPYFYKQVTTVTCDKTRHNTYTIPVGRCDLHTSQDEPNIVDMNSNALTCLGQYNKKRERVPDGPTINIHKASRIHVLYHPWHRHCIIWEMNLRQNISSGVSNSLLLSFIVKFECNSDVILLWDNTEKKEQNIYYQIQEWNTCTTTYDIFQNHSKYPTVCLLLETAHRTDHCITVCGKWIFDSNL